MATSFRRSAESLGRSELGSDVATSLGPRATSLSDVGGRCYDVVRCGAAVPATCSRARGGRATSLGPRATSQHRSRQGRPSEGATSHPCRATSPHRQDTDEALSLNVKQLSAHRFQTVRRRSVFTSIETSPTLLFLPFVDFGFQASLTSVEQSRALKQTALSFGELSIGRFSF